MVNFKSLVEQAGTRGSSKTPRCLMFQKPELNAESYEPAGLTIPYFSISFCRANRRKLNKPASGLLVIHAVII